MKSWSGVFLLVGCAAVTAACASSSAAGEADADNTDQPDSSTATDSSTPAIDAPMSTVDAPMSTVDAPPGAADAAPGGADAAPGGADAPPAPIDAAGICPTAPCDLVQQCGCTSPQVCDLNLGDLPNTACRTVLTPGTETSTCTVLEECAGGYVCVSGACSKWCGVDADCGNIRRKCVVDLTSGSNPIPGATTCSSACDPTNVAAGNCPAGFACRLSFTDPDTTMTGDETTFAICAAAGTATQDQACTTNADCAVDYLCVGSTCHRTCTVVPAGSECPGGTVCSGLVPTMIVGTNVYGACFVP